MGEALKQAYSGAAQKGLQFLGGLFMEQKTDDGTWMASLGRVSFWIVFGHLMWTWQWGSKAPDASEMTAFYTLLGYLGVKVVRDGAVDAMASRKGGE